MDREQRAKGDLVMVFFILIQLLLIVACVTLGWMARGNLGGSLCQHEPQPRTPEQIRLLLEDMGLTADALDVLVPKIVEYHAAGREAKGGE